jgi:hypothetical protein
MANTQTTTQALTHDSGMPTDEEMYAELEEAMNPVPAGEGGEEEYGEEMFAYYEGESVPNDGSCPVLRAMLVDGLAGDRLVDLIRSLSLSL